MVEFAYPVSAETLAAFERDGAVKLEAVIDDGWLDRLLGAVKRAESLPGGVWFKIYVWRLDPDFRAYCFESPVPGIAAQFLKTDKVNLLYDQLLVKPPKAEPTPWHNDLPYWPLAGTSVMSVWLALSPVTVANGGLEFIRGSNNWNKRFQPFDSDDDGIPVANPDESPGCVPMPDFAAERDELDLISFELEPGDAIAFHALTVHTGGELAPDAEPRMGYSLRFTGPEVRYRLAPSMNQRVFNPDLKPGDPLDSDQYPVVYRKAS